MSTIPATRPAAHSFVPVRRRLPRPIPPVTDETLDSYLRRLSQANHVPRLVLRSYLGIKGRRTTANPQVLSAVTGLPADTFAIALPEARAGTPDPRVIGHTVAGPPTRPRPACRRCMAVKGIARPVNCWQRHDQNVCLRHRLWIGQGVTAPEDQLDLTLLPEVIRAQQRHHRLIRRHSHHTVQNAFTEAIVIRRAWDVRLEYPTQRDQRFETVHGPHWYVQPFGPLGQAALYPELVGLTGLLASESWRQLARHGHNSPQAHLFYAEVQRRVLPDFVPRGRQDPLCRWVIRQTEIHRDKRTPSVTNRSEVIVQTEHIA